METLNIGETKLLWPTTAAAVLAFYRQKMNENDRTFTSIQLRFYVQNNVVGRISPSSTDRVLRELRQKGLLDYTVLNRGKSIYQMESLGTTTPPAQKV